MMRRLVSVNLGGPVAGSGEPTFQKRAVDGRHRVEAGGLEGDAPGARHGDAVRAKAVSAYPVEHLPFWETVRAQFGAAAWGERLAYGALGENLTLEGLLEIDVWVGDLLRFPDCTLAVSAPRLPTPELGTALGFAAAAKAMQAQAWCGFHLAARLPGTLGAGDSFELVAGPREIGIVEIFRARTGT